LSVLPGPLAGLIVWTVKPPEKKKGRREGNWKRRERGKDSEREKR